MWETCGAELILASESHHRATWGVHPGRGNVTGFCQVSRAAAGMAESCPGALRHTSACASVSHCSG